MILSDFLSRQTHDNSNLHEVIPILFNMFNTLYDNHYSIESRRQVFSSDKIADKGDRNNMTRSS